MTANEPQKPSDWWPPSREVLLAGRDIMLFFLGFAGIVNELFIAGTRDGQTMLFCAGLCGLPFILNLSGSGGGKPEGK